MTSLKTRLFLLAALLAIPTAAAAHPGHGGADTLGFVGGLLHPLTGVDHILAMLGVGLWAALRGGRALLAWPAAFVAALGLGFALGKAGVAVPLTEPAILASIIALGALTAANAKVPTWVGVGLIALFGAAHGLAHGAESPGSTPGFPVGMAITTAGLHLAGISAALGLRRLNRAGLIRVLGAGAALGGLALVFAG